MPEHRKAKDQSKSRRCQNSGKIRIQEMPKHREGKSGRCQNTELVRIQRMPEPREGARTQGRSVSRRCQYTGKVRMEEVPELREGQNLEDAIKQGKPKSYERQNPEDVSIHETEGRTGQNPNDVRNLRGQKIRDVRTEKRGTLGKVKILKMPEHWLGLSE